MLFPLKNRDQSLTGMYMLRREVDPAQQQCSREQGALNLRTPSLLLCANLPQVNKNA